MTPAIARRRIILVLEELERLEASVHPALRGSPYAKEAIGIIEHILTNVPHQESQS